MSSVDTRQISRDSLFLMATVRLEGSDEPQRVKVRNLSAGGMMAEGRAGAMRGMVVEIELRNIGWVRGSVAWVQDNRFGIAFAEPIDPKLVRLPAHPESDEGTPRFTRPPLLTGQPADPGKLRKI